jgi:SagB-type dehydrogenase family enzyme
MDSLETYRDFLKGFWWDERDKIMTAHKRGLKPPPAQKPHPGDAPIFNLVPIEKIGIGDVSVTEAIRRRRSHRVYLKEYLSIHELSYLLWATQGIHNQGRPGSGNRRTVPSAGARHPFETYLVLNRVRGLEEGLYRYLPREHSLLFLRRDPDIPVKVAEGCRGQEFVGEAAAVFVWTVIPYRSEWRYEVVAPKMIALDAGHVCQNLYLAVEAIHCGTCAIGAYNQEKMDALVGVDGKEEFVIYAAPVGKIPVS